MGYNRTAIPRAYVDVLSYHLANGWRDLDDITIIQDDGSTAVTFDTGSKADMFDMKPANFAQIENSNRSFYIQFDFAVSSDRLSESNFLAILNHNLNDAECIFKIELDDEADMSSSTIVTTYPNHTKKINAEQSSVDSNYIQPANDGWTLLTWTQSTDNRYMRITFQDTGGASHVFAEDVIMGGILFGKYLDFQSPNVNIETQIMYDGTDLVQSTGGATFANSKYFGEPTWNHTIPWNLSTASNQQTYAFNRRYGRVKHSMNLDYVTDTNLFSPNWFANQDTPGDWYDSNTIHSSFYNQIIGQHIPFLFSLDSTSTTTGDYGLYRLVENGFSARQVAPRIWNTNLDIIESW